jgi:hypothetical protein
MAKTMKKVILTTLVSLAGAGMIIAQDTTTNITTTTTTTTTTTEGTSTRLTLADSDARYRAPELSFDGFASASWHQQSFDHLTGESIHHYNRLGAGAGVNFFFLRMVGVGGDFYTEDTRHSFVDKASGNLIVRFPVGESCFAPYIFGGGGYAWDWVKGEFADGGAGFEFRFFRNIGIFIDGRYVFAHRIDDYAVARAGLRIAF